MDKTRKKVKVDYYDGINTICPFVCPTCEKPTLMPKCPSCGQLLEYPKLNMPEDFCQKLADGIEAVNPGYIVTAEELKSMIVIDTDDGTKGRHTLIKFVDSELLVPEGSGVTEVN